MSKETPDELAGWRRLLREPDALPGQGLADKDAAWDKLFERLNAKPRRRRYGYRIVAAWLLISLIPAARQFQGRPTAPKGMPVAEKVRPAAPVAQSRRPVATQPSPAPAALPRAHRLVPAPVTARQAKTAAHPEPTASPDPISIAGPVASTVIAVESTPPAATHLPGPPRKQWKVVDINELEPGHDQPRRMVADRQFRPLRLGLGIGNTGAPENTPSAGGGDSRLKFNLTTQNH
jgi:hypothetical protein